MTRAHRRRRRAAAALTASALVHGAVLVLLARYTPVFHPLWVAPRDFQVELVPSAPAAPAQGQAEQPGAASLAAPLITPRTAKAPQRHTSIDTTTPYPLPARAVPAQTPRPSPPRTPQPPTAPAFHFPPATAPFGAAQGGAGALGDLQGPSNAPGGDGDANGAGYRGALRTSVGCEDPDYFNLSKAERAICAREFGVQAALGARQYVDPISSAKVRNAYDKAREACERLNNYATPLDSDREHSAKAPGSGLDRFRC